MLVGHPGALIEVAVVDAGDTTAILEHSWRRKLLILVIPQPCWSIYGGGSNRFWRFHGHAGSLAVSMDKFPCTIYTASLLN